jgi:glycosyltransferase involved in cell wall biosynthesis
LNSVTIVCFTFPPYDGIGGRRWAKFAKYIQKAGIDVHVIAADKQNLNKKSNWENDIILYKENITFLPMNYPYILTIIPKGIIQKIQYRLAWYYVKANVKGNFFDHSSFFSKNLLVEVEKKINAGSDKIIVSCAPFHMAYEVIKVKEKYPNVTFIVDFRDPWTNNKTSFGYTGLSKKRLDFEKYKEEEVIRKYDKVISVSDEMSNYFRSLIKTNKDKCITIPNGFDIEDIRSIEVSKRQKQKCRFIFTGTLYDKSLHMFKLFCDALIELVEELPDIKNHLQIDFFGYVPNGFNEISSQLDFLKFHGTVFNTKVYEEIQNSDLALLFLTDDLNYSFSTKFYEYIAMNTSIVVVSKEGHTGNYIETHQLGYALNEKNSKEKLKLIYDNWVNNSIVSNPNYNFKDHEISNITQNQLLKLFN